MPKTKHLEHGQQKKVTSLSLTEEAIEGLDRQAQELGVSRSELVEMLGRKKLSFDRLEERLLGEFFAN